MPARAGSVLIVSGVIAYLLLPGHPLSLLRGVPLDWLGLAALIGVGCLLFAFGLPSATPRGNLPTLPWGPFIPTAPQPPLRAGEGAGG